MLECRSTKKSSGFLAAGIQPLCCLSMVVCLVSAAGCGPMDPPFYWEEYELVVPESPEVRLLMMTSGYDTSGKRHYDSPPSIRLMIDGREAIEVQVVSNDPGSWRAYLVARGEEPRAIPLRCSGRLSRWGHPSPPWDEFGKAAE